MIYCARFFCDPGSGVCLWAADPGTVAAFDYPIETARLPVSDNLRFLLEALIATFDTSLDWDNPAGPSPWSNEDRERWQQTGNEVLARLRTELGDGWDIRDERAKSNGRAPP